MHPFIPTTLAALSIALFCPTTALADASKAEQKRPTTSEVMVSATDKDWRTVADDALLIMELTHGTVVIELNDTFAPKHVANIKTMLANQYFDGLAIVRSQENYVAQWGDPNAENKTKARDLGKAKKKLAGEYFRSAKGLPFTQLPDPDPYAAQTGMVDGFPVGRDDAQGRAWLAHCYGMVGAGRGNESDSGNGAELYVITGHAPRHLDRNVTLLGRVLSGMEHFTTLPRGKGNMGFYDDSQAKPAIKSMRLASQLPASERPQWQVMDTQSATYKQLIEARRHRSDAWFIDPAGHVGLCNMTIPSRATPKRTNKKQ